MSQTPNLKIEISPANNEILTDLDLCAEEFIEFIDNFKYKFLNKDFFVLTAYLNDILVGILVAEKKSQKLDSLEKLVPIIYLHLLYVNPISRNKKIGERLLKKFLSIQKKKGIAYIYIKIPQNYKDGIKYLSKSNFQHVSKKDNRIIMQYNLWNDYGIRNCHNISYILKNIF